MLDILLNYSPVVPVVIAICLIISGSIDIYYDLRGD